MSSDYLVAAFIAAIIVFVVTYMWLYNKYRNVNAKYEVVGNTVSVTLQTHVSDQLHRKNKGLSSSKISGHNQNNHTARVKRIQHL